MNHINLKRYIFFKLYILLIICQLTRSLPYRLTLKTPTCKNTNSDNSKNSITITGEDIKNSVRNVFFGMAVAQSFNIHIITMKKIEKNLYLI